MFKFIIFNLSSILTTEFSCVNQYKVALLFLHITFCPSYIYSNLLSYIKSTYSEDMFP